MVVKAPVASAVVASAARAAYAPCPPLADVAIVPAATVLPVDAAFALAATFAPAALAGRRLGLGRWKFLIGTRSVMV